MARFRDRQLVRLARDLVSEEDTLLPAGSTGTVVRVYPDGVTYEVKFPDVRNIETIADDMLEPPD